MSLAKTHWVYLNAKQTHKAIWSFVYFKSFFSKFLNALFTFLFAWFLFLLPRLPLKEYALHIITDNCRSNSIRLCIASSCMCTIQCTLFHTHTGTFFSPLLALLSVVTQQRSLKQLPPASAAATLLNFPINMCLYTAGLQPGPSSAVSLSDHKGGTTRRWLWARHHGPLQTSGCTFYTYSCTFSLLVSWLKSGLHRTAKAGSS